jgi:hypothetical protein
VLAAASFVVWLAAPARAQDSHYWTFGYGPIGQLTEGTLVGGVSDLSATYYNPAACALIDRPRFVFNLTSIDIAQVDVPGAAGPGLDFNQMVFRLVPAMLAFHVGPHEDTGNHFAVAFLARYDSDFDLGYSSASVSGLAPDAHAGFGRFKQRVLEYWVGGSWSRRVSQRVSLGVSPFVAYRAQRSRRSLALEELTDQVASNQFVGSESEFNHVRVLAKLGVAWRPDGWELGTTLTTPGLKVWSNGKSVFNATSAAGAGQGLLAASIQTGLGSTYHAPWAAAFGATRRFRHTAIHSTVEWFSAVAAYDILELEPAPVAGRPETVPLSFRGEAPSVVNYAIGFEHQLGDSVHAYGGAARNFSVYVPGRDSFSPWDLTDVTAGLSVDRGRTRFAFGVGYAWGTGELQQVVTPPDASGAPPVLEAKYSRWRISFGASFRNE